MGNGPPSRCGQFLWGSDIPKAKPTSPGAGRSLRRFWRTALREEKVKIAGGNAARYTVSRGSCPLLWSPEGAAGGYSLGGVPTAVEGPC
jgi:hypothetical protein